MSIGPTTGVFTWTPTLAQSGETYQATVTVTDNGANAANLSDAETINITVNFNPDPVVPLPGSTASSTLAAKASASKSNSILVQRSGDDIQVIDQTATDPTKRILREQPLSTLRSLKLAGVGNKVDAVTVDLSAGGNFTIPNGMVFDGGKGTATDTLTIAGTSDADSFAVRKDTSGDHVLANGLRVGFVGVERVEIQGGTGNDTYTVAALSVPVTITDGAGVDTLDFSQSTTVGVNIDLKLSTGKPQSIFGAAGKTLALKSLFANVVGTPKADVIKGNQLANRIWGELGNDTIYGGAGDDWLYGGAGNDSLYGDAGNDVLLGGEGNDVLRSVSGRDLLIAGLGSDSLYGSRGDTILIGGTTTYDNNDLALAEIMKEWTRTTPNSSFGERCNNLETGIPFGLGTISLKRKTDSNPNGSVIDDTVRDTLNGAAGNDWFFDLALDLVKNRRKNDR
jgi:Ca2+-binding RTX toxin-like protein